MANVTRTEESGLTRLYGGIDPFWAETKVSRVRVALTYAQLPCPVKRLLESPHRRNRSTHPATGAVVRSSHSIITPLDRARARS